MSSGYVYLYLYTLIRIGVRMRTNRRGLRCCLFGYKGNTRASDSGTATVQSRFFYANAVRLYGSGALFSK